MVSNARLRERRVGPPAKVALLRSDDSVLYPTKQLGLLSSLGGIAHQTSSPVTVDHDDLFELPPCGEAGRLFSCPVTALQDHCCNQAFPHGLPHSAAMFLGGRTLRNQSGRAT